MTNDTDIIHAGQEAWQRLRKCQTFDDWVAIGHAILCGPKICMQRANVDKPRGIRYVRIMAEWLTGHGFREISSSARKCAASCAEHEEEVRAWLQTIPEARRIRLQHCVNVWGSYAGQQSKYREPGGCRTRNTIDENRVRAALDATRAALRETGNNVLDAETICFAVIRGLGFGVPEIFLRTVVRRVGDRRVSLPRLKCMERPMPG
jgi:hypothetical protein